MLRIARQGRRVRVEAQNAVPAERFRQIPTYTVEQYPNYYAPTYRTQVYKYYGITPGQERRLERRIERKQ